MDHAKQSLFSRKIIHTDMDVFYASVEQRDEPSLKGKAVAVGGGKRGVVAASSYEARKFGVFSAMPSSIAKRKCPDLIFVPPRFKVYKEVSRQVMTIFKKYTALVEPLSLDEAYLDITENLLGYKSARTTAEAIKKDILDATGLTASAGISFNKFLAKIASGLNKPNGLTVITPEKAPGFIARLPIEKFHGVGKVTAAKMKQLGIHNGGDLAEWELANLQKSFGKSGKHFYNIVHLLDEREVKANRIRKSIGEERTFENDISSYGLIMMKLNEMCKHLSTHLNTKSLKGKTVTVKIKYTDFTQKTRSKTISYPTNDLKIMKTIVKDLIDQNPIIDPVRLLGVSISNLDNQKILKQSKQINLDF